MFMGKCLHFLFLFWNCFPKNEIIGRYEKAVKQISKLVFQDAYLSLKSLWHCMKRCLFPFILVILYLFHFILVTYINLVSSF